MKRASSPGALLFSEAGKDVLHMDPPRFVFEHLAAHEELAHGVFTRVGGLSAPPCDSLNVSIQAPDSEEAVRANLGIIRREMGAEGLVSVSQVHGDRVVILGEDDVSLIGSMPPPEADGMLTDIPCLGLLIKQADCQAVILYDPTRRVIGNVHCGWRGNVLNIPGRAVKAMSDHFGCDPARILAGIGPSLGPCCGEFVGYKDIFPESFERFRVDENHFDLWALTTTQLVEAGLGKENIRIAGICTKCRTDLFFSYRGEGATGRFATVVMLR